MKTRQSASILRGTSLIVRMKRLQCTHKDSWPIPGALAVDGYDGHPLFHAQTGVRRTPVVKAHRTISHRVIMLTFWTCLPLV